MQIQLRNLAKIAALAFLMALGVVGAQHDALALPAQASPSRGLTYARQVCARCHAVGSGQRLSPAPHAPSFESVANTPGMTATALNVWLHTSHPHMPNYIIDQERIGDLSAYIATLKRPPAR